MSTRRIVLLAAALAVPFALSMSAASAKDVRRIMEQCDGRLCPWFKARIDVPAGWKEQADYGDRNKLLVLFPDKKELGPEDPMIYVRTSYNGDGRSLDRFAQVSNARWREAAGRTRIERQPDVPRDGGKGVWQVYRYENPGRPQQAHELLAFGEHVENGTQRFFYMVVVTASNRAAIDGAMPAWQAMLGSM